MAVHSQRVLMVLEKMNFWFLLDLKLSYHWTTFPTSSSINFKYSHKMLLPQLLLNSTSSPPHPSTPLTLSHFTTIPLTPLKRKGM